MSDVMLNIIIFACLFLIACIIIAFGVYFGLKARFAKSESKEKPQKYRAEEVVHERYPNGNPKVTSISNVEGLKEIMSNDNGDGFNTVLVDEVEYIIYEEQRSIVFFNKKGNKKLIEVAVTGYANRQREVNWIRVFGENAPKEGFIFYMKHNIQDREAFKKLMDKHLYGGELQEAMLKLQDTMVEIARFNELLASGKVRKRGGRYYQMY